MKNIRIAAVCMKSRPGAIDENLDRMETLVGKASSGGSSIICFPELSVTGYILKNPETIYSNMSLDRSLKRVMKIAEEYSVTVLAGLIELNGRERPYISHAVVGPDGLLGFYRKTHLSPQERTIYNSGEEIRPFRVGEEIFGIQLCYECHFPEISTILALAGSRIFFMPHASPRGEPLEKLESWLRHMTARAFDNAVFIAACNQVGNGEANVRFPGVAVILGPDGRVVDQYTGEEDHILTASLDMGLLDDIRKHRMRYFIPNRRPELYGPISS